VNAGKSTLLNLLAGRDAAIVSDEAGTTRDVVSVRLEINGVPVILLDTAGVRQTDDLIEAEGVRRAVEAARGASASLIVLDGSDTGWPEALESLRSIAGPSHGVILNKRDLMQEAAVAAAVKAGALTVSLREGTGLETVVACLHDLLVPANRDEGSSLITRERHRTALEDTVASLEAALGHDFAITPELAAEDYRRAADSLGRITGQINAEELLSSIFSSFCIGK
ncbi:MAG: GTPase, partial [Pseudomonadota bacterium]|nr:GTPase [Pseudomonadota bacterium]